MDFYWIITYSCLPLRATALGLDIVASRSGSSVAPLLMTLAVYLPTLPWIIYAVSPILAGLVVFFLPETRNLPLFDTIQDVRNKWVNLLSIPWEGMCDLDLWVRWTKLQVGPSDLWMVEPCLGYFHLGPLPFMSGKVISTHCEFQSRLQRAPLPCSHG